MRAYTGCRADQQLEWLANYVDFHREGHKIVIDAIHSNQVIELPVDKRTQMEGFHTPLLAERNKSEWSLTPAIVYIVKLYDNNENFYKIGLTTLTTKERIEPHVPYNYSIIKETYLSLYDAVYEEKRLHGLLESYKYLPKKFFGGHTECFSSIEIDKSEIRGNKS